MCEQTTFLLLGLLRLYYCGKYFPFLSSHLLCPSMCYFHNFLYREKTWNVSFLLAFQICFSSGQWNSLQKVAVWFTIICCGCELYYSAKKHSHCETAVSIHGGLEESCRFVITSHIILKTLNPWSLFQSRGPPAWGHDWAEFQIGFPYHTCMDENPVTFLELYQIFITSCPGT